MNVCFPIQSHKMYFRKLLFVFISRPQQENLKHSSNSLDWHVTMAVFKIHYHHVQFYYQNALHLLLLKPFLGGVVTTMVCEKIKTKQLNNLLQNQVELVVAETRDRPGDQLSTQQILQSQPPKK